MKWITVQQAIKWIADKEQRPVAAIPPTDGTNLAWMRGVTFDPLNSRFAEVLAARESGNEFERIAPLTTVTGDASRDPYAMAGHTLIRYLRDGLVRSRGTPLGAQTGAAMQSLVSEEYSAARFIHDHDGQVKLQRTVPPYTILFGSIVIDFDDLAAVERPTHQIAVTTCGHVALAHVDPMSGPVLPVVSLLAWIKWRTVDAVRALVPATNVYEFAARARLIAACGQFNDLQPPSGNDDLAIVAPLFDEIRSAGLKGFECYGFPINGIERRAIAIVDWRSIAFLADWAAAPRFGGSGGEPLFGSITAPTTDVITAWPQVGADGTTAAKTNKAAVTRENIGKAMKTCPKGSSWKDKVRHVARYFADNCADLKAPGDSTIRRALGKKK